jgi:hypothetical protein
VEALLKNDQAVERDLFVFSDAAKTPKAAEAVREVREYIKTISGFKSVNIVERAYNFGLARSIIEGVTSVVNERMRIIVLEDDLLVTPYFLVFMNRALDKYKDEQQVIQVSGYMFPVTIDIKEDALFLPLTTSWGWATWKRAWQLFDPDAKGYSQVKSDLKLRKRFNLDGAYDYFSMLEAQLAGQVDSWAVRWQLSAFLNDSLIIYPRHSLIVNVGFDGTGTHGTMTGLLTQSGMKDTFSPEIFPNNIKASHYWADVCRALKNRLNLWGKIKNKVQLLLTRLTKIEEISN